MATITAATAMFSACGRYRWWLERRWDSAGPTLLFIGLNPSRADAERDDPTLRRLQAFARAWGYGGLEVINLFARISASPAVLRRSADPVGTENDRWLEQRLRMLQAGPAGGAIWLGWGNGGVWRGRDQQVLALLASAAASEAASASGSGPPGCPWLALGLTAAGQPRHPLYVPGDARPLRLLHPGATFRVATPD